MIEAGTYEAPVQKSCHAKKRHVAKNPAAQADLATAVVIEVPGGKPLIGCFTGL